MSDKEWIAIEGREPISPHLHNRETSRNLPNLMPESAFKASEAKLGRVLHSADSGVAAAKEKQLEAPSAAGHALRKFSVRGSVSGTRAIGPAVREVPPKVRRSYPYLAIGRLLTTFKGSSTVYIGSATVVSEHCILTAGHNAFDANHGGPAHAIEFQPGFDDMTGADGGGKWMAAGARVHADWRVNRDFRYDFALLRVPPVNGVSLGSVCGSFGVISFTRPLTDRTLLGYPVESPYLGNELMQADCGQSEVDSAYDTDRPQKVFCELGGGMSGGPWLKTLVPEDPKTHVVCGLTSYGRGPRTLYSPWFGSAFDTFYSTAMGR